VGDDFTEFVHAQWRPLVRTAVFLGCALPDAEVVQTALMKTFRSWSKVSAAADPTTYAFRIMLNTLTRTRERRCRGERPTDRLPDAFVDDPATSVDRRDELLRLLTHLPREQQEVLVLRYVADLTEAQTATALKIPAGGVDLRRTHRQVPGGQHVLPDGRGSQSAL
jgi:RNA polymerase sigma factor (sigma-70 family)